MASGQDHGVPPAHVPKTLGQRGRMIQVNFISLDSQGPSGDNLRTTSTAFSGWSIIDTFQFAINFLGDASMTGVPNQMQPNTKFLDWDGEKGTCWMLSDHQLNLTWDQYFQSLGQPNVFNFTLCAFLLQPPSLGGNGPGSNSQLQSLNGQDADAQGDNGQNPDMQDGSGQHPDMQGGNGQHPDVYDDNGHQADDSGAYNGYGHDDNEHYGEDPYHEDDEDQYGA